MKNHSSLRLKNIPKLRSSLQLGKVRNITPKREKNRIAVNDNSKKKTSKVNKKILKQNSIPLNLNKIPVKQLSKFYDKNSYIPSLNRPRNISKLITKKIEKSQFLKIIKFVKAKLYRNYGYPYVEIKYKIKGEEDKQALYYDYYKINKIINNQNYRIVSKYHDYAIFLNDDEYLIRYSPRKDYYIIMKYLLFFVYAYDRFTYRKKCQKFYDLNEVKLAYKNLVSMVNNSENEENGEESSNLLLNRPFIKTQTLKIKRDENNKFKSSLFLKKINTNSSLKNNKKTNKRHSINFGLINNKADLLTLNISINKQKMKNDSKNNINNNKLNNIKEYYIGLGGENNHNLISCKLKKPTYLFISDINFKLVPNCLPNLFRAKITFNNIFDNYMIKIAKLKLNLYSNKKGKKQTKKIWWEDKEKNYNQFFREISFSDEEFYKKKIEKEKNKKDYYSSINRRIKNDKDIIDIQNLISEIEEMLKKEENISKNDSSRCSNEESAFNKLDEKQYVKLIAKPEDSEDKNINDANKITISSFTSKKSNKSNNFNSSMSSSSVSEKNNGNKEDNKDNDKYIKILNTNLSNSIIKNDKVNKKKDLSDKISEKKEDKNKKIENKNINLKKATNNKTGTFTISNFAKYNKEINKRKINLFNNNKRLNKPQNKRYILSTEQNKIKLTKNSINKNIAYMPYISDKINKNKMSYSNHPKSLSIDYPNFARYNSNSRPLSGKFHFKQTYEFAFGKYEERKEIKHRMNLIKEITTEFQKNAFLSMNGFKNQQKEYFPNLDFLISCRMKNKSKHMEERKIDIFNKNRNLTFGSKNKTKSELKKNSIKITI